MNVRAIEEHGASPLRKRRAVGQPGTASLPKSIVRAVLRSSCATFRVYRTCCSRARDIVRRGHRQRQERERERKKEREGEGRCEEATAGCARREEKKREEKRREETRRDEKGRKQGRKGRPHAPATHGSPRDASVSHARTTQAGEREREKRVSCWRCCSPLPIVTNVHGHSTAGSPGSLE